VEQFRAISAPSAAILLLPGKSELLSIDGSTLWCGPTPSLCKVNNDRFGLESARDKGAHVTVQRCQATSMAERQCEEMGIGDLSESKDLRHFNELRGGDGNVIDPEVVVRKRKDLAEQCDGFAGRTGLGNDCLIRGDADKATLSHRTGCPAPPLVFREPLQRDFMVDMVWPGKGDQDVGVKERDQSRFLQRAAHHFTCYRSSIARHRECRETVPFGKAGSGRQAPARQVGQHFSNGTLLLGGYNSCCPQNVVIDLNGRAHDTRLTSPGIDVNMS
jgi:hypothetical protein